MEPLRADDPRWIGPYRVLARLGSGGMGMVLLGVLPSGRPVAIKLVHAELAADPAFRARFHREVALARAVSGAFTAPVVDADTGAARPWLVTAYLPGLSLQQAVEAHGPLPPPSVASLAVGLAEALGAVHRAGVVHRDLKPSNVLLTPHGPRVIDFGIARAADAATITQTGTVLGSPGYMSPEQVQQGDCGPASDVFSFGAVLGYAATGRGPFGGGGVHLVLHRIVHEPPRLEAVSDPWLRDVILHCLDKEPARRPEPGVVLRRLTGEHRARSPHGTGWLPEPMASGVAHHATVPLPAAPTGAPVERRPARPRRALLLGAATVTALAAAGGGATAAFRLLGGEFRLLGGEETSPILWTFTRSHGEALAGPTVVDGSVYMVPNGGAYALDTGSGRPRWEVGLGIRAGTSAADENVPIAMAAGTGYALEHTAASGRGRLTAIDLATGRSPWRRDVDVGLEAVVPVVAAGVVCLPTPAPDPVAGSTASGRGEGGLLGFDARTGRSRWRYDSGAAITSGVAAADGVVYCAGDDERVHAVDAATGRRRWAVRADDTTFTPPVVAGGLVLLTTGSHTLQAFDAATGEVRWVVRLSGNRRFGAPTPVVAGGLVYFGGNDGTLYAFDAASGAGRWTLDVGGGGTYYLTPVLAGGTLYVYNRAGHLYALDPATGRGRWRQAVDPVTYLMVAAERPVLAGGLLHLGGRALSSFDPATGRLVRRLEQDGAGEPLGLVAWVTAYRDILYFHHVRFAAKANSGNVSAARARG